MLLGVPPSSLSGSSHVVPNRMLGFPWLGPERRPKTQRTELSLMAVNLGLWRGRLSVSWLDFS